MLIREATWQRIRVHFTEAERDNICANSAPATSPTLDGAIVDLDKLPITLSAKLMAALEYA